MSSIQTVKVKEFWICDDDENVYHANNKECFHDSTYLLKYLRDKDDGNYVMYAEVDV